MAPFRSAQDLDLPAHFPEQFVQAEPERTDPGDPGGGKVCDLAGRRVLSIPALRRERNRVSHASRLFSLLKKRFSLIKGLRWEVNKAVRTFPAS
jgi:hypothetical protein